MYALCIEPLLCHLRKSIAFTGLRLPLDGVCKLSAYADDVTLFLSQPTDIVAIQALIQSYESVSNAKVNWQKTCGLSLGGWNIARSTQLMPGKWSIEGIKVLGVHLGNANYTDNNWVQLENKINRVVNKWSYYAKGLSFKGRILILNVLCASNLWHVVRVLQPPQKFIDG